MSQMEPLEPMLQSPLSLPLIKQKQLAIALLNEMGSTKMPTEGMLLSNLEKDCKLFLLQDLSEMCVELSSIMF